MTFSFIHPFLAPSLSFHPILLCSYSSKSRGGCETDRQIRKRKKSISREASCLDRSVLCQPFLGVIEIESMNRENWPRESLTGYCPLWKTWWLLSYWMRKTRWTIRDEKKRDRSADWTAYGQSPLLLFSSVEWMTAFSHQCILTSPFLCFQDSRTSP